jgi:hypothetical protein
MNFLLVFESTGDSIPFKTINTQSADVLSYYVDYLNSNNLNRFVSNQGSHISRLIDKLNSTIVECNEFIYELLDRRIDTYDRDCYLNQKILNKIHADWVRSQSVIYNISEKRKKYNYSKQAEHIHSLFPDNHPAPSLGVIIEKLGIEPVYSSINRLVHTLETELANFNFSVADQSWVEFTNPFSKEILTNDISNFALAFHHLGRSLYDKFINHDHELEFDDENSYNELLGFIDIRLVPPQTIPLSKEYISWCNSHNKIPSGGHLNIANVPDLSDRLTDYRTILFKNSLQNNASSIQLNKGN